MLFQLHAFCIWAVQSECRGWLRLLIKHLRTQVGGFVLGVLSLYRLYVVADTFQTLVYLSRTFVKLSIG